MPITFDFSQPANVGNLGPMQTVASLVASLPGYEAFFNADDAPPGRITNWPAIPGRAASFVQNADTRRPMRNTRDGMLVLDFDGTEAMALNGLTIGSASNYTIGARIYQKTFSTDAQVIFGYDLSSPTYRLMSRYANGDHFYRFDSDQDITVDVPDVNSWHTVILCQGGGLAKLSIDGSGFATVGRSVANLPGFYIGNGRDGAGNGIFDVRSMSFHRSDLSNNSNSIETLRRVLEIA